MNWELFQPIGKNFGTVNQTQFCIEKKPCLHLKTFQDRILVRYSDKR